MKTGPLRRLAAAPEHMERWRRIAYGSQQPVIAHGGHAYDQHSRQREKARRLRQAAK